MKERQEELEKKKQEKELAERLKTEEKEKKRREKEEAEKLKAEEKEKKRREKEEADKAKNEEKEKKRKEKEEKERKKREKEEEAAKKARSQLTLTGMFGKTISIPQRAAAAAPAKNEAAQARTPSKDKDAAVSVYDQMFKPFFVKEHVKLAPNPCDLDDEAREHKTRVLEEYVAGKRASTLEGDNGNNKKFDPVEVLQIPFKLKRGRVYPSVKKIMKEFTTESSQTPQTQHLRELLKTVPVKSLKFYQDVRPPYIGTISGLPPGVKSLRKVSRNPFSRNVLPLAYDYDSEAEWQDEEGEDVDDLDDEDEIEGLEGDEDMDDFLDDADDTGPSRMVFSGGMEPEITGLCWENKKRMPSELRMCKFRMEFIHGMFFFFSFFFFQVLSHDEGQIVNFFYFILETDKLEHHHTIDPFSTIYWACPKAAAKSSEAATSTSPSSKTAGNPVGNSSMPPPPTAPTDAFQALGATGASARTKKSQQLLPIEFQEKLKAMVRAKPTLSKVGVIELFVAEHPSLVKGQVKNSFDALIVKVGKEHRVKGE